jgi:mediator of RNA polymerase II transcription subunit 25
MAGCLLQQCGWTSSMDVFFKWLGSISFLGGGYGDAAVAEALAEVLMVPSFFSQ